MYKRFLSLTALPILGLGLMVGAAVAQDQPGPPPNGPGQGRGRAMAMDPDQRVQMLATKLNLNDDQKSKIRAILVDDQAKMQAMREDTTIAPEDRRAKAMAMREDSNTKIKALLTDDQKAQYDEMMAKQRQRFQRQQGAPTPQ
jgi:Spy/CpxP family protein refolding chaperone